MLELAVIALLHLLHRKQSASDKEVAVGLLQGFQQIGSERTNLLDVLVLLQVLLFIGVEKNDVDPDVRALLDDLGPGSGHCSESGEC